MKIVSINASPNRLGSTSTLLKIVEDELSRKGNKVTRFDLYDYRFNGCLDCSECSKPETNFCSQQDDLIPILDKIDQSAGFLFGSPNYFGQITGVGKCFVDRLYGLLCNKERSLNLKKKVFSYIFTQGEDLNHFRSVRTYMNFWFYDYIGLIKGGSLFVGNLGGVEDLYKQPQALIKAKKLAIKMDEVLKGVL